jgi:hypothetical protein
MHRPKLEPRVKQTIKNALEAAMYAPTHRRFEAKLKELLRTNTTAARYVHESFTYKGEYYSFEFTHPRFKTNRLLPELQPSMDEYLAEKKHLEYTEVPFVVGFFNKMLNASNSVHDYLQILPESLHSAIYNLFLPAEFVLPREMTDEQVEAFKEAHKDWLLMLKKRMVLELVIT